MAKRGMLGLGMLGLGLGYFLWYTPYSALAKALSGALLPGIHHPVGGLMLLPATVLGQLAAMPVFVYFGGWQRYSGRRRFAALTIPFPSRYTFESAIWMAVIVGTTTLNFTFPSASIVLMLLLMRVTTLMTAPVVDLLRRRKIHWYSTVALTLCMVSAIIALAHAGDYKLTAGAVLSVAGYAVAYYYRFRIISAHAKTGDWLRDRRYFIEEHMTTPFVLLAMTGLPALVDQGPWMHALRIGFTTFLATPAVLPALLIGVCYEGLFVMTSLIFLNRREFSFGVPVHVTSSLLAGVAASIVLHGAFGAPLPSAAQYAAAALVVLAALILSYDTVKAFVASRSRRSTPGLIMFVCGGNTGRSPMAAAIARAELAAHDGLSRWLVGSAGVSVSTPGAPISHEAAAALAGLGVDPPADHRSRQLTPEMCAETARLYCMTRAQRDVVAALAPAAAARTVCLDPQADVPDPGGQPLAAYQDCAARFQTLIRERLREQWDN